MKKHSQSNIRRRAPAKRRTAGRPQSTAQQETAWLELGRVLGEAVAEQGQDPASLTAGQAKLNFDPQALAANPQFAEVKQSIAKALASLAECLKSAVAKQIPPPAVNDEENQETASRARPLH
jgi:hypothetical protein